MGLVLGIIVAIVTTAWLGFMAFAAGMSDSPSAADEVSYWPWAVLGYGLTALLIISHYWNWGW